jgi:serralysin
MNPDVAAAVESGTLRSGYDHYLAYGKAEGRSLTPLFDSAYYLAKNADVKAAGLDAWTHFMNYGWREGRDPSAYLDVSGYLDANADLKAAGVNPLTHYLQHGQGEGRLLVATSDLGLDWTYLG